jgi:hypothetical protein
VERKCPGSVERRCGRGWQRKNLGYLVDHLHLGYLGHLVDQFGLEDLENLVDLLDQIYLVHLAYHRYRLDRLDLEDLVDLVGPFDLENLGYRHHLEDHRHLVHLELA